MRKLVLLTVVLAYSSSIALAGGGWVQKRSQGYFKLAEWWIIFDEHYTDQGLIDPNLTSGIFNTNLYAEYGLTDRFTGLLNAAVFSRSYMNNLRSGVTNEIIVEGEAVNALGDIDLGLKYGITAPGSRIALSGSIILGIPTGVDVAGTMENLQTGDGEFNQIVRLDAGTSIHNSEGFSCYANAYAGLNKRSNGFSDEYRLGAELGVGFLTNRLWLVGKLDILESMKNGSDTGVASNNIFANNTEFSSLGAEINGYVTKRWGLSVSYANAYRGEIIAAAPSYSVGIFFDTSK